MTPRRSLLRPSVFVLLALVSSHVPACEYGSYPDPSEPTVASRGDEAVPVLILDAPVLPHA